MKPEDQRVAIAEACGWCYIKNLHTMSMRGLWKGVPPKMAIVGKREEIPDYLNDLNEMHEAEKVLDEQQIQYPYCHNLYAIVVPKEIQPFRATAAHRAEAFLRTIGKWKEEK